MSIEIMSLVWERGPEDKTKLLVLLALADNADATTGECWPSYNTIANRCRISRTYCIRIINQLCSDGWLSKSKRYDEKGDPTSNLYTINLVKLEHYPSVPSTPPSAPQYTTVVNPSTPKPSIETSIKHQSNIEVEELPPIVQYFLGIFNAKRVNPTQFKYLVELEQKYGIDKCKEAIEWCALENMSMGRAIKAMTTALPKWGQKRPPKKVTSVIEQMRKEKDDGNYG